MTLISAVSLSIGVPGNLIEMEVVCSSAGQGCSSVASARRAPHIHRSEHGQPEVHSPRSAAFAENLSALPHPDHHLVLPLAPSPPSAAWTESKRSLRATADHTSTVFSVFPPNLEARELVTAAVQGSNLDLTQGVERAMASEGFSVSASLAPVVADDGVGPYEGWRYELTDTGKSKLVRK